MAGPKATSTLKLGTRKNVKSAIEKVIDRIIETSESSSGYSLSPKMKKFIAAFVWAWVDLIDDAAVKKGRMEPKDVAIFAIKRAIVFSGLSENDNAECLGAFAAASVSVYENFEVFESSMEIAAISAEMPLISAVSFSVALGAAFAAAYDINSAINTCKENKAVQGQMAWFKIEYNRQANLSLR